MDVARLFYLHIEGDQITPDLRAKVAELVGYSSTKWMGSYGGENVSRIELPDREAVDDDFERMSLEILLHRETWPALAGDGSEYPVSKNGDGKLQIKDDDAQWVAYPVSGIQVGLRFDDIMECLENVGTNATPELIKDYMTNLHVNIWGNRVTDKKPDK